MRKNVVCDGIAQCVLYNAYNVIYYNNNYKQQLLTHLYNNYKYFVHVCNIHVTAVCMESPCGARQ